MLRDFSSSPVATTTTTATATATATTTSNSIANNNNNKDDRDARPSGVMLRDFSYSLASENGSYNTDIIGSSGGAAAVSTRAMQDGKGRRRTRGRDRAGNSSNGSSNAETWRSRARVKGDIGSCLFGPAGQFLLSPTTTTASVSDASGAANLSPSPNPATADDRKNHGRLAPTFSIGTADIGSLTSSSAVRRRQEVELRKEAMLRHAMAGHGLSPSRSPSKRMEIVDFTEDDGAQNENEAGAGGEKGKSTPTPAPSPLFPTNNSSSYPPHIINLQSLRRISSQGIHDVGSHRAVAWRVLLGYLPCDSNQWNTVLHRDRTLYRNLVAELFVQSTIITTTAAAAASGRATTINNLDSNEQLQQQAQEGEEGKETEKASAILQNEEGGGGGGGEVNTPARGLDKKTSARELLQDLEQSSGDARSRWASPTSFSSPSSPPPPTLVSPNPATITTQGKLPQSKAPPPPRHIPASQDGYSALVPARIREQWKLAGREAILNNHCTNHILTTTTAKNNNNNDLTTTTTMNALLVIDDEGYEASDVNHDKQRVYINDDPLYRNGSGGNANASKNNNGRYQLLSHANKQQQQQQQQQQEFTTTTLESKWHQFFENAALLDEIRKDVVRTHPDLHFFLEPEENLGQRRYAALERILFVWAKLNKGVRYVQGMNEIIGTIYYVLANDFNEDWAAEAEADSYFLFNTLMVEMRDVFVPDLDEADTGIQGRISNMMSLLSMHDPEVRCHLDDCGIDPSFYSIRWLTTLLSREFCLPDTIRLWDSMFASTHKDNFLRYVCVTMVMMIRDQLLSGDFSTCLRLLQSYPPTNVDRMLETSRALWIYESQITLACHKGRLSLSQALATIPPPPDIIMAYGLPSGIAVDRAGRARYAGERGLSVAKDTANAGKNFLGSAAKGIWNSLEKSRSGSPRQHSRKNSYDRKAQSMPL